jgi:N-acetyl-anhydromuramyl-L-alanine amidase AmpD
VSTYLELYPPKVRQFRTPRRAKPSGLIVVHTAESILDQIGEDTGAEDVADFIRRRSDYGSYHTLVDTNSRVRLVPFDAEAYGDGTGSNPFAIHISFACKAAGWAGMDPARKAAMVRNGAAAAYEAAQWLKAEHGIEVPPARVTRAESEAREPGFISHGERDPGRRSDPGADFPWAAFMREFVEAGASERMHVRLTTKIRAAIAEKTKLSERIDRWRKKRAAL